MPIRFLSDQSTDNQITIQGAAGSDPLLRLFNSNSGSGALIRFSDQNPINQTGGLTFFHTDTASYGSGAAFTFTTNQTTLSVLADGKLLFKEGLYIKPSTGTGGGTQLITSAGAYKIPSIVNAGTDTDQFLVRDSSGNVDFRTGAEVRSDIGAGTGSGTITGSGTAGRLAVFSSSTALTNSRIFESNSGTFIKDSTSHPVTIQNDGGISVVEFEGSATSNESNLQITPGSLTAPGLNFGKRSGTGAQDSNTGIYSAAADKLSTVAGGTEIAAFTTNGTILSVLNAQSTAASVFLTSDSGVIKTRTAAQVRSDIGAGTGSGSMSSWILKEGNGVETSTVTNGETVTFAQGAGIETELTSTSSGGTLTISNTITNNNQLTNGEGYTSFAEPGIFSGGGTPTLASGVTGAEIRSLIGAGTSSTTGTVTSVGITPGTGISVSGSPITGSGSITVTNSAPDQTVALTAGIGISVSGTYPNFTITNSSPSSGGTVTGTGSTNKVAKFTAAGTIGNSTITDDGSNVSMAGDLTVSGGDLKLNGSINVLSNASASATLNLGDVIESDTIQTLNIKTWGATQMSFSDSEISINAESTFLGNNSDLKLGQFSHIELNHTSTSGSGGNGFVIKVGSGSTTAGKVYYMSPFSTWVSAVNTSSNATRFLGVATGTSAGAGMLLQGIIRLASHGFSVGNPLYLSSTSGNFTTNVPSASGAYVRVLGYAVDTNHIYFSPDHTWVERT